MGGVVNSAGGFLGLSKGPQAPGVASGNDGLSALNDYNSGALGGNGFSDLQQQYMNGGLTADQAMTDARNARGSNAGSVQGLMDSLATGSTTGSKFATEQVQNNPILGSLFGKGGQLEGAESRLNDLQNQGFELKPEDMTLYGQTSGNIARMFGAQGNQISQDLASRGLASAPSGAAGAMFSGLNGNQNEMLQKAQMDIMQQRFANTQNQIAQQQSFINSLGQQAGNDINQQYGRQLSGAQDQRQGLMGTAGLQTSQNNSANEGNMAAANFNQKNKPLNIGDLPSIAGATGAASFGKSAGQGAGAGLFG